MRIIILIYFLLYVSGVQANLQNLLQEFVKKNLDLVNREQQIELVQLSADAFVLQKSTLLSFSTSYDDNQLDTASTFNLSTAKNWIYGFDITKSFFSGTTLKLSNQLVHTDRSAVNTMFLGSSPAVINEFSQSLEINQDLGANLWGRIERLEKSRLEESVELERLSNLEYQDQQVVRFYQQYLQVVKAQENLLLQQRAYQRSVARTKLVKRKWKDGLAEKVEVLQAHNAQMTQKEQLQLFQLQVSDALKELSILNHRAVKLSEIEVPKLEQLFISVPPQGTLNESYIKRRLVQQKRVESLKKKQLQKKIMPQVRLSAIYKSNRYADSGPDSLQDGYLTKGEPEIKVALTLSTQWDFVSERNALAQQNIKVRQVENDLFAFDMKFGFTQESMKKQLELLARNIALAKERIIIAKRVLKEYTRLYRVGKTDLDQLIRAEETLISTEVSLLNYYISYEQKVADLSQLFGGVKNYLLNKKLMPGVTIEKVH